MLQTILEQHPELKSKLFIRGFLLTNDDGVKADEFPFYGAWNETKLGAFRVYTHPLTGFHTAEANGVTCFLFGHAYNPFTMETEEEAELTRLAEAYRTDRFYDALDELTGIFVLGLIDGDTLHFFTDATGLQSACCRADGGKFYLASHAQMLGDICHLPRDPFVDELIHYKWYPRMKGNYMPADLTPFADTRRVLSDADYVWDGKAIGHTRFYPLKDITESRTEEEYEKIIEGGAEILHNSFELIFRKWKQPWQSLTGGVDSNTAFAAANGNYDKLHTFSYVSAPKETIDADAAEKISAHFGVPWTRFDIPDNNDAVENFDAQAAVLRHNNSHIGDGLDNEWRKRMVLARDFPGEIEVKGWVSETIRGYWYKHFGRKKLPKLSARLYRNWYKIFICNRVLAHKIDKIYARFLKEYEYDKIPASFEISALNYMEVCMGSWGSRNISEMKYCFDITVIYNNRKFLDLMLHTPLDRRISDKVHFDLKKTLNRELYDLNIRVVNMHETDSRARMLNAIFDVNQFLPF